MHELGDLEPFSRESEIIRAIAAAYAPADSCMKMTTRQITGCGAALSPRLSNRIAVRQAMVSALTEQQRNILWFRFVRGFTQVETACRYGISLNTQRIDEMSGLQTLARVLWQEPAYVSPPRVRRYSVFTEILAMRETARQRVS